MRAPCPPSPRGQPSITTREHIPRPTKAQSNPSQHVTGDLYIYSLMPCAVHLPSRLTPRIAGMYARSGVVSRASSTYSRGRRRRRRTTQWALDNMTKHGTRKKKAKKAKKKKETPHPFSPDTVLTYLQYKVQALTLPTICTGNSKRAASKGGGLGLGRRQVS